MKTICGWCSKVLNDGPVDPITGLVSHGMCGPCYEKVMGEPA